MKLVSRLSASLHGGASRESQQANCFDHAVLALRRASRGARQRGPSRRLSIDGVGLTTLTTELTIWTIHLDDADARRPKVAREPGTVAACTLHADAEQRPVPDEPGQELAEAGACRRKQSCSEQLPGYAQCRGSMHILMRVNATEHVLIDICLSHTIALLRSNAKMCLAPDG